MARRRPRPPLRTSLPVHRTKHALLSTRMTYEQQKRWVWWQKPSFYPEEKISGHSGLRGPVL